MKMKAAVLTGIRRMEIIEIERPGIEKDTDVLLKVDIVGVCGSDVHYFETGRIGSQVVQYPYRVGHECAGTVMAVGTAVDRVKVGDRVVVDPAIWCHDCDQCKKERFHTCRKLRFLGCPGQIDGCLCEYIVMPQWSLFPVGEDEVTPEQGVLCEPFAIGVYAVRQSGLKKGDVAAVLGAGPIGLSCLKAAQAYDAGKIYMTEIIKERIRVANEAGADWVGNPDEQNIVEAIQKTEPLGVNVVYEAAGQQETLDEAVEILEPGGKLMIIGIPRQERVAFNIDKMRRKEISVINVRRQNECTREAIDLISSGTSDLDFMVTHRFGLGQAKEAFELVADYRDGVIKAMICMD